MTRIIDYYASDNKEHWLSEINKSDWRRMLNKGGDND